MTAFQQQWIVKNKEVEYLIFFYFVRSLLRILCQRHDDVGVPGAVEVQSFVLFGVPVAHVHPSRVDAEQHPRQFSTPRPLRCHPGDHWSAACAAVHLRIGQEVALSLKTDAECRGDDCLSHDGQMMQGVVKTKWKTNHEDPRSDFDFIQVLHKVIGCKRLKQELVRQCRALKLQSDNVYRAGRVDALSPY